MTVSSKPENRRLRFEAEKYSLVYLILLTWNQRNLTLDCLESLSHVDYPNCRIIVVDNGSTDGTAEAVRTQYPGVTVLVNSENLGFVEGNNAGIRQALVGGADYILLLNNDTVVDPLFLRELVAVAESDPQIGIVGPKIYYYDQPSTIWSAGNAIDWQSGEIRRLYAEKTGMSCNSPYKVDYVTGCALCIKRQVIEEIGLLDPRFCFYYEETDWCARARNVGFQVMIAPRARIWHKVSATIGADSPATTYYMSRNIFLFLDKNLHGRKRLQALMTTWLREMRTIAAHSLKPRYRHLRRHRNARVLALRDTILRRWGKMGPDVAAVCYPDGQ